MSAHGLFPCQVGFKEESFRTLMKNVAKATGWEGVGPEGAWSDLTGQRCGEKAGEDPGGEES